MKIVAVLYLIHLTLVDVVVEVVVEKILDDATDTFVKHFKEVLLINGTKVSELFSYYSSKQVCYNI